MTVIPLRKDLADDTARNIRFKRDRTDLVFRTIAYLGGSTVLLIMIFVGIFLSIRAIAAINDQGVWKFLTTQDWSPDTHHFGIAALAFGTVMIAAVAVIISVPISLAFALFITEISTGVLRRLLQTSIDLMAAIPSLIFGLWGMMELQLHLIGFAEWMSKWFGWIPFFNVINPDPSNPIPDMNLYRASTFIAGCVVALMIVPIQTSIMVEAFSRAPDGEREGAYALGATRWGVICTVVLPFGKGGIIGGAMLGLGRALGETIAIYLIISPVFKIKWRVLQTGGNSIASHIALNYAEASAGLKMDSLMAAGLGLFFLTMMVNFIASTVIARSRSGADSEG